MNLQLVTFETAVLGKSKSFDNKTPSRLSRNYYNHLGELNGDVTEYIKAFVKNKNITKFNTIDAPEQELLKMWLREKHDILIGIYSNASGYCWEHMDSNGGTHRKDSGYDGPNDSGCWDTYELALENALQYGLGLIK